MTHGSFHEIRHPTGSPPFGTILPHAPTLSSPVYALQAAVLWQATRSRARGLRMASVPGLWSWETSDAARACSTTRCRWRNRSVDVTFIARYATVCTATWNMTVCAKRCHCANITGGLSYLTGGFRRDLRSLRAVVFRMLTRVDGAANADAGRIGRGRACHRRQRASAGDQQPSPHSAA